MVGYAGGTVGRAYGVYWPTVSIQGIELAWQQPIGKGFGADANYTYADAKEKKSCVKARVQNAAVRARSRSSPRRNVKAKAATTTAATAM